LDHFPALLRTQVDVGEVFLCLHCPARGFGTLDEIFEVAPLIQTRKVKEFPLVLIGGDYWCPLLDFLCGRLVAEGTIDATDYKRIPITDSAEEAVDSVTEVAMSQFGLTYGPRAKRRWFLWE
jgi:hypothetical protein